MDDTPAGLDLSSVDRASEGDRVWFEIHPHRSFRVRPALMGEFPDHLPASAGWRWAVVRQIQPGVRIRGSFASDAILLDSEERAKQLFHSVVGRRT